MTHLETIRAAQAASALAAFKAIGIVIDLTHNGATASGLIANLQRAEFDEERSTQGGIDEALVFLLPRQSGFDGAVQPGDVIAYPSGGAERYTIRSVDTDGFEAVYVLEATKADAAAGVQVEQAAFTPSGGSAIDLGRPLASRIKESARAQAIRAGTLAGPAALAQPIRSVEVELLTLDLDDNLVLGAKGTLALTIRQAAGGSQAMTIAGVKLCAVEREIKSPPYTRRLLFRHEGPLASSPIAVA